MAMSTFWNDSKKISEKDSQMYDLEFTKLFQIYR